MSRPASGFERKGLLSRLVDAEMASSIREDLAYARSSDRKEQGPAMAALRHFGRVSIIMVPLLLDSIRGGLIMGKNYLKMAFRNFLKDKEYSFLNLFGMAAGLAAFILISLYVRYELSFDRYHQNADRTYRVVRDKPSGKSFEYIKTAVTPAALAPALLKEFPEVASATRLVVIPSLPISRGPEHFLEKMVFASDPQTFEIFSIPFLKGDPRTALRDSSAVVLSEKAAARYFGHDDPIGRILTVDGRSDFRVAGVFRNMPENSHFLMDVIIPYETYFKMSGNDIAGWGSNFSYTYILMRTKEGARNLEKKFAGFLDKYMYQGENISAQAKTILSLQPMTDIHLRSSRVQEMAPNNDIVSILLFSSIAFLFLLVSCINYMNLSTARSARRGREVGIRKVVGAVRGQLVKQFLSESLLMSALASSASLVFVLLALPAFNRLVGRPLTFRPAADPWLLFGLIVLAAFVGLLSGGYPALSISAARPVAVLKGVFAKSRRGLALRNILVLAQFSITMIAIIIALVVRGQMRFIKNRDMGYDRNQIMIMETRDRAVRGNIQAIKEALRRYVGVVSVTTSHLLPNNIDEHTMTRWPGAQPDEQFPIYYNMADYDFVDLFGIKLVQGRNFSRDFPADAQGAFLVNETAVKRAGWTVPLGRELIHWEGQTGKIVGVMKDFHFRSLHQPIEPLYVFLSPDRFSYLSIKIKSERIPETVNAVKAVLKRFAPDFPFEYTFFDDVFARTYEAEQRMMTIFGMIALLSVIVACLGLFGLASYAAEQRTKEIGIRKVLGASNSRIFVLLSREFLKWVLLSGLIAWPVAYLIGQKWLQNFSYHIRLSADFFLVSLALAFLIALLTVSSQSIRAAVARPVKSLKYE